MYQFPIGMMLESLKMDYKSAIKKAAQMGAKGLQLYSTYGEFAPENMTRDRINEWNGLLADNGLVLSAVCGDLGKGFGKKELNPELVERSKRIMELAKELHTDVVTTHIGVVPQDKNHERYKIMQEACYELSRYADSLDAHFAIETGPETSLTLKGFLDSLGSTGVAVNLDPANLVMVTGDDPVQAVYNLKDYIVHTHAKDGRKLLDKDPEIIYGVVESEMLMDNAFIELPLGTGDVDFPAYLKALDDIGYKGFLTIEREVGDQPVQDIQTAMDFLTNLLKGEEK